MRHVQWTLWPCAAPIWVEAVLLQSLPGYLSHPHHARSASLQELAGVFGSQGMTRARSIELPLHPPMPGPVALEDAKYRIDQATADIERLRQEIQMAPSEHEQRLERSSNTR